MAVRFRFMGLSGKRGVQEAATPGAARGRPRDGARHDAVLEATRELLAEGGYPAVTVSEIAVRAGVTRQLIYRWWPSVPALVAEAVFGNLPRQVPAPADGPLRDDLHAFLRGLVRFVSRRSVRAGIVGLMAAGEEARGVPELETEAFSPVEDRLRAIVTAAAARGEAHLDADIRMTMKTLRGAIVLHIVGDQTPEDDLIEHLTDVCVAVFGLE